MGVDEGLKILSSEDGIANPVQRMMMEDVIWRME